MKDFHFLNSRLERNTVDRLAATRCLAMNTRVVIRVGFYQCPPWHASNRLLDYVTGPLGLWKSGHLARLVAYRTIGPQGFEHLRK